MGIDKKQPYTSAAGKVKNNIVEEEEKSVNMIEKLQERLNHRFTALEEDIVHLIREELLSLEITPEPFWTVRDVWDDVELYSFDENLSNRCEEKIQAFLYELLADCVKELGMDEVRTYLITQGWTDEIEEMDMEDLILPWDFPYPHCHHCHGYM